jgi:hypothetical protein
VGAREGTSTDRSGPRGSERGGDRARWLEPTGGTCLSGIGARGRGRAHGAGSAWAKWAEMAFLFPGNF